MESIKPAEPIRKAVLEFSKRCGASDMFSWPPAIAIFVFPKRIESLANITAFNPEPQTLFIVKQGVELAKPALKAACLAGA